MGKRRIPVCAQRTSKENREGSSDFLNSKPLPILNRAIEDVNELADGPHLHLCAFLRFFSHRNKKPPSSFFPANSSSFQREGEIIAYRRGAKGRRCWASWSTA